MLHSAQDTYERDGGPMVRFCNSCLMPDTRPRIVFDEAGVCNACHTAGTKNRIDWDARREEFLDLAARHKSTDAPYDCIVPWSGGKDSSTIAYRLKFEYGLNPLLVTFSPLMPNNIAAHNREALINLGFDHVMVRANQKVSRRLARRFFIERGDPKVHWNAGINSVPVQIAVNYKIPLIFYAEHGESEYGGRVLSSEHTKMRDFTEVLEHQICDDPANCLDEKIDASDLAPYVYPDLSEVEALGVKALYFGYFFRWNMLDNWNFIKDKIDFRTEPKGRTDGTFTNFDSLDDKIDTLYYHMQFIKFGFGRATRDACRMIQNGQMSRAEGRELALKYDAEFPDTFHEEHLEFLSLNAAEFAETVDRHRDPNIWLQEGNRWVLRHPPT